MMLKDPLRMHRVELGGGHTVTGTSSSHGHTHSHPHPNSHSHSSRSHSHYQVSPSPAHWHPGGRGGNSGPSTSHAHNAHNHNASSHPIDGRYRSESSRPGSGCREPLTLDAPAPAPAEKVDSGSSTSATDTQGGIPVKTQENQGTATATAVAVPGSSRAQRQQLERSTQSTAPAPRVTSQTVHFAVANAQGTGGSAATSNSSNNSRPNVNGFNSFSSPNIHSTTSTTTDSTSSPFYSPGPPSVTPPPPPSSVPPLPSRSVPTAATQASAAVTATPQRHSTGALYTRFLSPEDRDFHAQPSSGNKRNKVGAGNISSSNNHNSPGNLALAFLTGPLCPGISHLINAHYSVDTSSGSAASLPVSGGSGISATTTPADLTHSAPTAPTTSLHRFSLPAEASASTNNEMFTHSQPLVSSPPSGPHHSSANNNSSTSFNAPRTSRLRGLSYLRNYTANHLLSRDSSNTSSSSESGIVGSLTRSATTASAATRPNQGNSNSTRNNRLTLVTSPTARTVPISANTIAPNSSSINPANTVNRPETVPEASPEPSPRDPMPTPVAEGNLIQSASAPLAQHTSSDVSESPSESSMTRQRASTTGQTSSATAAAATAAANAQAEMLPSLRLSAYYDPRSTRPSLTFPPISRTLPTGTETVRVGRYSERDSQSMSNMPGNLPSAAPVGFKSKVVSRRHCEFWYENGKWWIKDVKSSSGTFLNHIRLSPPSQESKPFPVNDGDIVQLGIDFKGGEEMIFRCVKMRLELNRGWQNKLNSFNVAAHKRLRTMGNTSAGATAASSSQDCSICLNSIAPCQSLFVAPCSHTWHFKCVRSLLTSPQYPIFICPNCRAGADLEADVEEPSEEWERLGVTEDEQNEVVNDTTNGEPSAPINTMVLDVPETHDAGPPSADATLALSPGGNRGNIPHAVSEPLPIKNAAPGSVRASPARDGRTPTPPVNGAEGPITPRNDAGPWVFDGSAGGSPNDNESNGEMRSIDAAADVVEDSPN